MKKYKHIYIVLLLFIFIACEQEGLQKSLNTTVTATVVKQVISDSISLQQKSYDDFINTVWKFESSIDPAKQQWYNKNWNRPVKHSYPAVLYPGRVVRDPATGDPIQLHNLTIQEYFKIIGIIDMYDPSDPNPNWREIQASVINYLGFVGFQFQESDLVVLGYYKYDTVPVKGVNYPSHYVDIPNHYWENGVTQFFTDDPDLVSTPTVVTDTVNFKDDLFLGKNGIYSVADFKDPDKQVYIIKDHFQNKYEGIVSGLKARGKELSEYLGTTITWNGLKPPVSPPPGKRSNTVKITLSGLLAGAHLRGAQGVVALLVDHKNPQDESGTYILQYVQDYAGYKTPFSEVIK